MDHTQVNQGNRIRTANRYLKRINYGNKIARLISARLDTNRMDV